MQRSIESTVAELGGIFSQLAGLVQEQGELIQRIDADIDATGANVEGAHSQIVKYYASVNSNRGLILKTFAFQFLNNYFSLFFISFLKYGYIFGIESTCKQDDCMAELETQLMVLAVKDIFLNIVQTGMPFLKQRKKVC